MTNPNITTHHIATRARLHISPQHQHAPAKSMHCEIALACVLQPRISKDRAEVAKEIDMLSSSIPAMEGEAATGADMKGLHSFIKLPPQPEEGAKCDEVACSTQKMPHASIRSQYLPIISNIVQSCPICSDLLCNACVY